MSETCEKFLEEILTTEHALSAEAAAHVKSCAVCAALRRDAMAFTPPAVPEALDMAVLSAAGRQGNLRMFRRRMWFRAMPFAAAALALVAAGVVLMTPAEPVKTARPVSVATVQTQVQTQAVSDWTALERESYALDFDLSSCQYAMNNW